MKKLLVVLLASSVGVAIASADGQKPGDNWKNHPPRDNRKKSCFEERHKHGGMESQPRIFSILSSPDIAERIGLTKDQIKLISKRMREYEKSNRKLREKISKAALEQARLMTAKDLDEKELLKVVDELGNYRTAIAKERVKLMIFMRKNITPEQMQAVRKVMRERMEKNRRNHNGHYINKRGYGRDGRHERKGSWQTPPYRRDQSGVQHFQPHPLRREKQMDDNSIKEEHN